MKYISSKAVFAFILFLWVSTSFAWSQVYDPVKWTMKAYPVGDNQYELVFKAKIDKGWHLYSQHIEDGGPIPTSFHFDEPNGYSLEQEVNEQGEAEKYYEELFEMDLIQYSGGVSFCQTVTATSEGAVVKGSIEYMTCRDGECLPPVSKTFEIPLVPGEIQTGQCKFDRDEMSTDKGKATSTEPGEQTFSDDCGTLANEDSTKDLSLWAIFLAGFIGGLIALLTPCVFPIIPLTVSFFTKTSTNYRKGLFNALLYALNIVIIYVGLGYAVTASLGPQVLNELSSNVAMNLAFFVIFLVFAISFFGAFEIALPGSWANKIDTLSNRGGYIGIFFMAFTLSIVSFSCTGPIIGTLLVETAVHGNIQGPLVGMTGFAVALALPFALFAAFPAWLNSLPKSGSWLQTVKVSLGYLELAFALKFFSNPDQAYHWGLLKREVFIALWVIIALLLSLYLLGVFNGKRPKWGQAGVGVMAFVFAVYMLPGIWGGSKLTLLSGLIPPTFYSVFQQGECPQGITCFHDLNEGLAYAREHDKPVMLDFTGWTCTNCRRMEDKVWSEKEVLERLTDDYVLISLYVDDRQSLPKSEQYYSEATQREIKTVGDKWSELQVTEYDKLSQPWYVLIDTDMNLLANPRGYTPSADEYRRFLDEGLCRFGKKNL